jgi:hypothetical protein
MESMIIDIEKTKQEIAFNNAAMPYKLEALKNDGNTLSRNPVTGEMEVYNKAGERVNADIPGPARNTLSQQDGYLPTDGKYRQDK